MGVFLACPCSRCKDAMFDHLVMNRIMKGYDVWYFYGESLSTYPKSVNVVLEDTISIANTCDGDDMMAMLSDIF